MDLSRELISPDWPVPGRVRALMTTSAFGDLAGPEARRKLGALLPQEPAWLRQVHGNTVVEVGAEPWVAPQADASFTRRPGAVCAVMAADCMPVLLAEDSGAVVAAAHAGWRGLCSGVIESAVAAMGVPPASMIAWLGPAIGPRAYEVGPEVREAFIGRDRQSEPAFVPHRPGRWLLDLYAVARQRLAARGVTRVFGGDRCTFTERSSFFSFRRDRAAARMAALIWLA